MAVLGPKLVAVMVKVTLVPTVGVGLLTVFVIAKSEEATGTGVLVAVLFAVFGSDWFPVIVAVLA
ncbi:hypothetical protein D3C85_1568280 [compost metagenome]